MELLWLCLVAFTITVYVVLDGFDLGVGGLHLLIGRTEEEKQILIRSIGPVWDGNEVWLLAGGGVLYFAFPLLYASSFSGFYLPLMIVLWLLILRGISVEMRNHLQGPIWRPPWDFLFGFSSTLLAIFFGAALGNVIRGVPLQADGYFFLPLWTDFGFGEQGLKGAVGILDWYTILVGVLALATLLLHGARWIVLKTEGALRDRAEAFSERVWWVVAGLLILVTGFTLQVQPQLARNLAAYPWGFVFPLAALLGIFGVAIFSRRGRELQSFLASCLFIAGMLTSAAFGIFPYVLFSNQNPQLGLTLYNSATASYGLKVGLAWWIPGMILATAYFVYLYRSFAGKIRLQDEGY